MTSLRASALLPSHQPRVTAASSRLQHLGRQRPCSRVGAHRPPTTRVEARRRGSLDASIDEVIDACSSLERLYAGSDGRPAVDSPQTLAAQQQQPPQQDAKRASRGSMDDMACGKAICVEQREAAAAAAVEAAASDARAADFGGGASGSLGRLLEWLPFSPRTQGILMLNLLVLLVATNWVVVKDVGNSFDPFGFAFLRFAVAAAAFSPFMPVSGAGFAGGGTGVGEFAVRLGGNFLCKEFLQKSESSGVALSGAKRVTPTTSAAHPPARALTTPSHCLPCPPPPPRPAAHRPPSRTSASCGQAWSWACGLPPATSPSLPGC